MAGMWNTMPTEDKTWVGVKSLLNDLQKLSTDYDTGDVVFVVGDEECRILAHRVILVARCEQFRRRKKELWSKMYTPGTPFVVRKPGFRHDVFREVIRYLYTGKIEFQNSTAFETLRIAEDLEISDLQHACEQHFMDSLDAENAAEFLADAMALSGGTDPNSADQKALGARALVDKCIAFMEENAEQVVKSRGFSNLPKQAVIRLISSEQFAVSENEVWRAVFNWAKKSAGINKPVSSWTNEDRKIISQELSGVIEHVKLLLIDSSVFAEEVEPTGVVPMELSLERYRFAALPTRFRSSSDPRLRPRMSSKLFHGSTILSKDSLKLQRLINEWCGKESQEWMLLFKASTAGFSADAFHEKCDGHTPTVTIIKGRNGDICGAFSDQPWRNDIPCGKYMPSKKAFIFSLVNSLNHPPTKFDVVNTKYATLHHPKCGPMFGAGADLCISDRCNENMESYSNLPHSYAGSRASSDVLMGGYNFFVQDYEVFTLKSDDYQI
ncbi:BTB/POZ domain-containing protein 19-like [Nematostella vectensis]|uniref:BTB/POZ domain-containing protein 19-like n=1 Tax=Nematostella vectensis TaxID=45351 RepID=UPI002077830B|nr:BTB/POZ domain-containing protein 19-like [Nematostella vectensis]